MLRRKSKRPQNEMSPEEMRAEIRQYAAQALVFAREGDVSGMETMLEHASQLAEQLEQRLPSDQIDGIKRIGYQAGIESLKERIETLTAEGNEAGAQQLQQLIYSYQGELLPLTDGS